MALKNSSRSRKAVVSGNFNRSKYIGVFSGNATAPNSVKHEIGTRMALLRGNVLTALDQYIERFDGNRNWTNFVEKILTAVKLSKGELEREFTFTAPNGKRIVLTISGSTVKVKESKQ